MAISLGRRRGRNGDMKVWVRSSAAVALEPGWIIADGSVVADSASEFNTKPVPDMRGSYPKGHPTLSNANFGADVTYFAGGGGIVSGGAASVNLGHDHGGTGSAGSHNHGGTNNAGATTDSQGAHTHVLPAVSGPITVGAGLYPATTSSDGAHAHNVNNHAHGINSDGGHAHGLSTALGSTSIDPLHKTLIWIFKIK